MFSPPTLRPTPCDAQIVVGAPGLRAATCSRSGARKQNRHETNSESGGHPFERHGALPSFSDRSLYNVFGIRGILVPGIKFAADFGGMLVEKQSP